jgi:hypothetical protein
MFVISDGNGWGVYSLKYHKKIILGKNLVPYLESCIKSKK